MTSVLYLWGFVLVASIIMIIAAKIKDIFDKREDRKVIEFEETHYPYKRREL